MKKTNNITLLNTVASMFLNVATILSGFIVPKLIITYLGSEVNGLYLSLEQYLNYFSLMEGGLGGVIMATLYKPLFEKDFEKVSQIIVTAMKFFRKIAAFFLFYLVGVAALYPILVKSSFSYGFIFSLTLILGINFFIRYYAILICRILLSADRKVYVTAFIETVCLVIEVVGFIIAIKIYPRIHVVKLITVIVYIFQLYLLERYVHKNYEINYKANKDSNLIAQRWNGMGVMTAAFIHQNTDIVILTIFQNLKIVSVYSIYSMITNALKKLISSVVSGVTPSIGALIAEGNKEKLLKAYNSYEFLMTYITSVIYSCCAVLITPFVAIYTKGVKDVNYIQPLFGFIIVLAQMFYCLREPTSTILYSANKYKELAPYAYIEAAINIIVSIACVHRFGLVGVAVGTAVSIILRHMLQLYYLSKHILERKVFYSIKLFSLYMLGFFAVQFVGKFYYNKINTSYLSWIKFGFVSLFVSLVIFTLISIVFYRHEVKRIYRFLIRKGAT